MASHRGRQAALLLLGSFFPVLDCLYTVNKFSSSYLNDGEVGMLLLTVFLLRASLV